MIDLSIAQAIVEGEVILGRSANFADDWQAPAVAICNGFGVPPPEVPCPEALFAKPFGKQHVVVVQVAGPPTCPALRFRVLILGRALYSHLGDPFAIAEHYPPNWEARGSQPDLDWPPQPLPPRTIAQLDAVLKNGDGPFLLGASQTLVDGGKIALQRPAPESKLIRDLWALLPDRTRCEMWPATFAFSKELGFDIVALPVLPEKGIPGYLSEDQTRDYPDSRYERNLQLAIETADQRDLDRLLARRNSNETLRLAVIILVAGVVATVVGRVLVNLGVL